MSCLHRGVAVVSLFAAYQVRTEKRVLRNDLSHRAEILGATQEASNRCLNRRRKKFERIVERFSQREHLKGWSSRCAAALSPSLRDLRRFSGCPKPGSAQKLDGCCQFCLRQFSSRFHSADLSRFALAAHHAAKSWTVASFTHELT